MLPTWSKQLISTDHTIRWQNVVMSGGPRRAYALIALQELMVSQRRTSPLQAHAGCRQLVWSSLGSSVPRLSSICCTILQTQQSSSRAISGTFVHLDFGRSWVASVVQTALPFLPCQNLEQKWEWLTDDYLRWCRTSKKQAHVSKITAYLMSYGDTTGAMGQWSKGALSTNLLQWLVDLLGKIPGDPDGLLAQCRVATYRLNSLFRLLYRSGAFLTAEQAAFISDQGLSFLRTYAAMARVMYNAGKQWLFPLYPKLHVFHHLILTVRNTASSTGLCCSPMMYGCQMDEDVVGKTSRLSRRVNIRKVSQRALDRYLVAAFTAYSKAKLLGWKVCVPRASSLSLFQFIDFNLETPAGPWPWWSCFMLFWSESNTFFFGSYVIVC